MKKLKLNLIMAGIGILTLGALTSCGGSSDKKAAEDALARLNRMDADFATVSGQIEAPLQFEIQDEKDPEKLKTVIISWEADETLWTISSDTVNQVTRLTPNLPALGEDPINFKIKAVATCNKAVAKREFEGTLLPTATTTSTPISTVYSGVVGEEITVQGVARDARSGNGYVVCDATGCTYVYDKTNATKVIPGNTIKVTGLIAENAKTINANPDKGITTGGTVGCRQIAGEVAFEVINDGNTTTIPQGDHIGQITIDGHRNFIKDPGAAGFVNHVGEVYKCTGYLYRYSQSYGDTFELIPALGTTSPYLSFYANTSNSDISAGLNGFYGPFENQLVEATFMVYDINQSSSGSVSWRNICLDIVAAQA